MEQIRCSECGVTNTPGHTFCGGCGRVLDASNTPAEGPQIRYSLRSIQEDGSDGESYDLPIDGVVIGRTLGAFRFGYDATVSPAHAEIRYVNGHLTISDRESLNGVFIRIRRTEILQNSDVFQCGEQILRFEMMVMSEKQDTEDVNAPKRSTKFLSTRRRPWRYKLTQLLADHEHGAVYCAVKPSTTIGREACDMNFAKDHFISGTHCLVEQKGTTFFISDLESRNGTFLKIRGDQHLREGDSFFVGKQLLRVEVCSP